MKLQSKALAPLWLIAVLFAACNSNLHVDLLVKGAKIYTVDSAFSTASVMAIDDGKIVAVGNEALLTQYTADSIVDATGKFIYPGLIDAHSHFYGLGMYSQTVDLTGTKSWDEVLQRCSVFVAQHQPAFLTGRGWDQNDWDVQQFPTNAQLNTLFPNIPVLLKRVDGHAAIANTAALSLAGIKADTKIDGGEIVLQQGKPTGVLIDNAVDMVQEKLPKPNRATMIKSLLEAQQQCLQLGLTSVCDAGLDSEVILLIDSLQQAGALHIRVYAMISANDKQVEEWLNRKPIKNERLNAGSFKMYADGALGSRGACLLQPYHDEHAHHGLLLTPADKMELYVKKIAQSPYQLNTHCIGDSANRLILHLYGKYLGAQNQRRWRIEHAQVVHPSDFNLFGQYNVVPSVQPTHATSDMYWAEARLGKTRLSGAYALKTLLKQNGWLPLGTDFPVEYPHPFYTFYAAVARMDAKQFPQGGFQTQDALTREEALRGMTIWAAMAAFEEQEKGSLERGKLADFIITDLDLMQDDLLRIRNSTPLFVFLGGKRVK